MAGSRVRLIQMSIQNNELSLMNAMDIHVCINDAFTTVDTGSHDSRIYRWTPFLRTSSGIPRKKLRFYMTEVIAQNALIWKVM